MKKKIMWMVVSKDRDNIEVGTILATKKPTPLQAHKFLGFDGAEWWIFKATPKPPVELP